jgi:hypothetical protein
MGVETELREHMGRSQLSSPTSFGAHPPLYLVQQQHGYQSRPGVGREVLARPACRLLAWLHTMLYGSRGKYVLQDRRASWELNVIACLQETLVSSRVRPHRINCSHSETVECLAACRVAPL